MKKKGFTLVELLAVVIILTLVFLFISPKLAELIKRGNNTETELIEKRVLNAAREYANTTNNDFYTRLVSAGDVNYIYKTDLINNGLIDADEAAKLDNFAGVKGELLADDSIRYTIQYIDNPINEYSNEELYVMIQALQSRMLNVEQNGGGSGGGGGVGSVLSAYPVGSIYISTVSTNPGTIFGGTWQAYGTGKTLVGVDTSDTDFSTVQKTGGSKTVSYTPAGTVGNHTLTINEMPNHGHAVYIWSNAGTTGNAYYTAYGSTTVTHSGARVFNSGTSSWFNSGSTAAAANGRGDPGGGTATMGGGAGHNHTFTGTAASINVQSPYITVYMFKRTA